MDQQDVPVHRKLQVGGLVLIMACSLTLLAYIGYGEAWRTYPKFELERLAAQGETVQKAIDPFLQAGLPIAGFPGFVQLTRPLLDSDASIGSIAVVDPRGVVLFSNVQAGVQSETAGVASSDLRPSKLQIKTSHFTVAENDSVYRVSLELRNKIEPVGTLELTMPRRSLGQEISTVFVTRVAAGGLILMVIFAAFAAFLIARRGERAKPALAMCYGVVFFLMAAVVVSSLVDVYSDGIRNKTKALADSLGQRLAVPLSLGLQLDDFSQLDAVFGEYRDLYPDLSYVTLTQGDTILIDSGGSPAGSTWRPYPGHYEYAALLPSEVTLIGPPLAVRAGIPEGVIYDQIWRSAKNFFVLFMASGFLAMIFFNLLHTLAARPAVGKLRPELQRTFQENIMLPVLFLTIFIEALSSSFMPQYLQQVALANGADSGVVSTQFTVYYAALAIALLPVGRFIDSGKMKWVLILSVVLEIVSLALMATVTNVTAMFAIRALAGAAHGIMATGAQAGLLMLASRSGMTHGASRFLFTYNSGIISGTAIGALLAVYIGFPGVFALATLLVIPVLLFAVRFLPVALESEDARQKAGVLGAPRQPALLPSLFSAVSDRGFASAALLVGIPSKIVNAGVIAFALPLVLAREAVAQEDIGQIIMFYPIGILLMSLVVSRIVARLGQPRKALILGTIGGALGVASIGFLVGGLANAGSPGTVAVLLIVGLLVLGLAHGMINAPIVTYVVDSLVAEKLGRSTVSSVYRFVERTGHMAGPIVVSQLLIVGQQSSAAITWIGVPVVVLGLFFWLESGRRRAPRLEPALA